MIAAPAPVALLVWLSGSASWDIHVVRPGGYAVSLAYV
jgi:hypothetical protein